MMRATSLSLFLTICVLFSLCFARTQWFQLHSYSFEEYEKEFHKIYENHAERTWRKTLFEQRLQDILFHNLNEANTWKKGVNHLTDRNDEELRAMLGYNKVLGAYQAQRTIPTTKFSSPPGNLPSVVDWRTKSIISPVKDQGQCGSCWTFASSEAVESYWALATGRMETLSEQQIASCTPNPDDCGGTGGCGGGIAEIAFDQIMKYGGLASEWTYPYISYHGDDYECTFSNHTTPPVAKLKGYQSLPPNQYSPVMRALAEQGPLVVNVDAGDWSSYETGVFSGCNQQNPDINHVVQLVGYGTDSSNNLDYWLVRNSWSPSWGEDGYIRLVRPASVNCGIDLFPQDGTGCNGGPNNVTVCGTCGILYSVLYPEVLTL